MHKKWPKIYFGSVDYSKVIDTTPYQYKMIRSAKFYNGLWEVIDKKSSIKFIKSAVKSILEHDNGVEVITDEGSFMSAKVFNSIDFNKHYLMQEKYPVLQQHFIGWFIKTQ